MIHQIDIQKMKILIFRRLSARIATKKYVFTIQDMWPDSVEYPL
jgi:hypothetical protein